jgi:lipoprotein signal peptidase
MIIGVRRLKKSRLFSYVAMVVLLFASVTIDIATKNVAQKKLLVWSSPDNLHEYRGDSIPMFSFGQHNPIAKQEAFYVGFSFTYVRNQGAAWGMLSDLNDKIRVPFFHLVTLIAVLIIFYYLWTTPFSHRLARISFILILSGAIGNFIDRIRFGYVVDFLDVHWVIPLPFPLNLKIEVFPKFLEFLNITIDTAVWAYDFPKFNWADSMITIGVIFLIFDALYLDPLRRKKQDGIPESLRLSSFV